VTLHATSHPVVDVVRFQLLTLAVAEARGIDPDPIRRDAGSAWADAAGSAYPG
jgi:glucosamine 6-phosphate synthetase-like amidotransferase/phosphosugar isomerase protein